MNNIFFLNVFHDVSLLLLFFFFNKTSAQRVAQIFDWKTYMTVGATGRKCFYQFFKRAIIINYTFTI